VREFVPAFDRTARPVSKEKAGNMTTAIAEKPEVAASSENDLTEAGNAAPAVGSVLLVVDSHYEHKDSVVSDFVFEPVERVFIDGDDTRTVFRVMAKGKRWDVSASLFSNVGKFQSFCNERGLSWDGSIKDLRGLYDLLQRAEVPRKDGKTVIGLHGSAFVMPDESFGQGVDQLTYVPPSAAIVPRYALDRQEITEKTFDAFSEVARLHDSKVITPILGWFAAAPLRSTMKNFPPLAVMGGSGNGKSTLVEKIMAAFGLPDSLNLFGTTRYGVLAYGASTNAFPVWFDEYRNGMRADTRAAIDQLLRDAWDGSSSPRGGMTENVSQVKLMAACAPIIVSGEDTFSETSHIERLVIINLPKKGKKLAALRALGEPHPHDVGIPGAFPLEAALRGFGRAYLEWLLDTAESWPESLVPPRVYDRQEHGRAICRWGYDLLGAFCLNYEAEDILPPYDDAQVVSDAEEAAATNPISEAIEDAFETYDIDRKPIVWDEKEDQGEYRYVRVGALCRRVELIGGTKLPGGAQAVARFIRDEYGAQEHNHRTWRRCLRWPKPKPVTSPVDTHRDTDDTHRDTHL
jgi:hypothetical protein